MSNTNLINDIVLPGSMLAFRNNSVLTNAIKPQYDDSYKYKGAKAGAPINIRTHQEVDIREDSFDIDVQDREQKSVVLPRSKVFGADFVFSSAELAQDTDGFMENLVAPTAARLAAKVDHYIYNTVSDQVYQACALPVTNIDSDDILNLGVLLDNASVDRNNRTVILGPKGHKQLVSSSASLFNSATEISQQYRDGIVKLPALGFNFGMSNNVSTHTTGSYDANYDIAAVPASGATSLSIDTGTGTIKKGEIVTIAGVNSVNKNTKEDTGELAQFVVTADNDDGGTTTISISPPIISTGPYQNVTALPAVNADLVFLGTASTSYQQGLAFDPRFAAVGFCDLEVPDVGGVKGYRLVEDGVSMTCITGFDIKSRNHYMRFDILMGAVAHEPSMAARIYTP